MKETCLKQIEQVRVAIANNSQAYTYRSRLGRLVVTCLRLVTNEIGVPQPTLPGLYKAPAEAPQYVINIVNSCNKLFELSRVLSQPSEPLEERWKSGWEQLHVELNALYKFIKEK